MSWSICVVLEGFLRIYDYGHPSPAIGKKLECFKVATMKVFKLVEIATPTASPTPSSIATDNMQAEEVATSEIKPRMRAKAKDFLKRLKPWPFVVNSDQTLTTNSGERTESRLSSYITFLLASSPTHPRPSDLNIFTKAIGVNKHRFITLVPKRKRKLIR